jgi:hypothetical protein
MLQVVAGRSEELHEAGLEVVRHLRDTNERNGIAQPPCLLATGRYDDQLAFAFIHHGGTNVIDRVKRLEIHDVLDDLWATRDGTRWTPPPIRGGFDLDHDERLLLPFLEKGLDPTVAVQELRERGLLPTDGYSTTEYSHAVRKIANKAIAARDRLYPQHLVAENPEVERWRHKFRVLDPAIKVGLAEFARHCGHCWLRLDYEVAG